MASFKGNGRGKGQGRRGQAGGLHRKFLALEYLEDRTLLANAPVGPFAATFVSTSNDIGDVKNGPMAKAGSDLISIYQEYQAYVQGGSQGQFVSSKSGQIYFDGNSVGVTVRVTGDLNSLANSLRGLGMRVDSVDGRYAVIDGQLPLAQLPAASQLPQVIGVTPLYKPIARSVGSADNQADRTLNAPAARNQFNVNGSGVTVGVISTSYNLVGGGIAASVGSGDLPGGNRVNILQDNTTNPPVLQTDEGRAMMENIFDIAPGVNLQGHTFISNTGGEVDFANSIRALAGAGSQIIVDDLGVATEPYYQDGPISQAVAEVVGAGVTYFSSAGNSANQGFESPFRAATATVGGTTGTFMNFNPAGTTTTLPITVNSPGLMVFQFDQPFTPNQTGAVTSDVDILLLDANGAVVAAAGGNSNNIATQQPIEFLNLTQTGNFQIAIRVNSGPNPGRVVFYSFSADITVSQQFGNAGGISYPTTFGHPTADAAIGVGAVPFWGAPPFTSPNPVRSEDFSSFGPAIRVFDANGNRLPAPQVLQKPDVSGPDAGNTTFFGSDVNTTNTPPQTPTDLDPDTQPNFFGTSSSAPNLAAVAALMKQRTPSLSPAEIRSSMIASATPLNGSAKGTWEPQGGFGLVDAVQAVTGTDLTILSASPSFGQNVGSVPTFIDLVLSRPVDPASLDPRFLAFTVLPAGVVGSVAGNPFLLNPTTVRFPVSITAPLGVPTNGVYRFVVGGLRSTDAKTVRPFESTFGVADQAAPRVTNVDTTGRLVVITFSEPMRESSINRNTIGLIKAGGNGAFPSSTNINLVDDPRTNLIYDAPNNRLFIDLTGLDQSQLTTDNYLVGINDLVTDQAGNRLDGEFSGLFPSGNGQQGGIFLEQLSNQRLVAPQVTQLSLVTDSGVANDGTTNTPQPAFIGQIRSPFPGSLAGVTVIAQFNGLRGGLFDLDVARIGQENRGFVGTIDGSYFITQTNGLGQFFIQAPAGLPDGLNSVRIVVVGPSELPGLPGLSSSFNQSFRIDTTSPVILPSVLDGSTIPGLLALSLNVVDPVLPSDPNSPIRVPTGFSGLALDPQSAGNLANYTLLNLGPDNIPGTADDRDLSSFISSATFVPTSARANANDPYTGRIDLTFAAGVPTGRYILAARTVGSGIGPGLVDPSGNAVDGRPDLPGNQSFGVTLNVQPVPAFVTGFAAISPTPTPGVAPISFHGPRSYFETQVPGTTPRAPAPPSQFVIDFSNPLRPQPGQVPAADGSFAFNTNAIQLLRSTNRTPGSVPDGDFGVGDINDFTALPPSSISIRLTNSIPGATFGQPGFLDRLVVSVLGGELPPDHYRIVIPNSGPDQIVDLFGNVLDGEFLGNPTAIGSAPRTDLISGAPEPGLHYETLQPSGQFRIGLSGDGIAGGTFATSFVIVPAGNVIYARPDYFDDPNTASDDPDGSLAKPYAALAPEAEANPFNGGDLNSGQNFGNNFNPDLDRNGNGRFDRSAIFAAQVAAANGPVVLVALPGLRTTSGPQATFVSQASTNLTGGVLPNDASFSVPFNTTLVFAPGSTLKLQNASVFVQNQGSSLLALGGSGAGNEVTITSYSDDSIGGDSNRDGSSTLPAGGDWGGIVFRNYDQRNRGAAFPVDNRLRASGGQGPGFLDARSGADDLLSSINFAQIRYAGGAVPRATGTARYDAVTSFNSRPAITNSVISLTGGLQAAISADLDSFREDNLAKGLLVRRNTFSGNSLNGIWVRPTGAGTAQQTNAILYPNNPSSLGGIRNFVFDDNTPYILTSRLVIGEQEQVETGGDTIVVNNRAYIQPGMLFKSVSGAGIDVVGGSINIGDRTYLNGFDADPNYSPATPGFRPSASGDARVVFTSFYDDVNGTFFFDPNTQQATTIVSPNDAGSDGAFRLPTPGNVLYEARWGGVTIRHGAQAVIDEAQFRFGGGALNLSDISLPIQPVLTLGTILSGFSGGFFGFGAGARVSVTNNDFFDNLEAAIGADPNALQAGDPLRPLLSAHPFFRGNVMQRNSYDALRVYANPTIERLNQPSGIGEAVPVNNVVTQTVDAVWDATDLTYVLRGTIALAGEFGFALPSTTFTAEPQPAVTLTIQSALPGTLLANGETIGRPGESVLVKLMKFFEPTGDGVAGSTNDSNAGAGFLVGVDDGNDPTGDALVDPGLNSQIRIVGVGANEATGQQRVPAILTSLLDNTVSRTTRGVNMTNTYNDTPNPAFDPNLLNPDGSRRTTPAPGDAGLIYFGGNSLTDYNLLDPRNGNIIDNADVRFFTRIEMQGGGVSDIVDANNDKAFDTKDDPRTQKLGITPATQRNSAKALAIVNSNLSSFSQVGVLAHPGFNGIGRNVGPGPIGDVGTGGFLRTGVRGQPTDLYMVNSTVTNMPVGVRVNSDTTTGPFVDGDSHQEPFVVTLLHNTFDDNGTGLRTQSIPGVGGNAWNSFSHVRWLAMDNIFSNHSVEAITADGQQQASQAQSNLFFGNTSNISVSNTGVILNPAGGFAGNNGIITGDPRYRNAAAGDYRLLGDSAAIDSARSEFGPNIWGNTLQPLTAEGQTPSPTGNVRSTAGRLGGQTDWANTGFVPPATFTIPNSQLVRLPGSGARAFPDSWVAALPGTPGAVPGPASNGSTFWYVPIVGERDQNGFLRVDVASRPNVGSGRSPFFDVGAFEFRQLDAPRVTLVNAVTNGQLTNLYVPGGTAGTNKTPQTIGVAFSRQLDPNTVNSQTVLLEASGGDGIFGNGNSPLDRMINLSGRLTYNSAIQVLLIDISGLGLASDVFRLRLIGTGDQVIRDAQGNVLDGENTDPNGVAGPLPSGDGFPGGNFSVNFSLDTSPPVVINAFLNPASDPGNRDVVTNINRPSIIGLVYDQFPPANPGVGQLVVLDVSSKGDGNFDMLNVGLAFTTPVRDGAGNVIPNLGQFDVTPNVALPDSIYNVGPDGRLATADDRGISIFRVRVFDQSGNQADLANGNALAVAVIDTKSPQVVSTNPANGGQLATSQNQAVITINVDENIDPASLNPSSVVVFRTGGDGVFGPTGTAPDVQVIPASITVGQSQPFSGAQTIQIVLNGPLPNDFYALSLLGAGPNTVRDIAGNPIAGGGNFNMSFTVFNPGSSRLIYVDQGGFQGGTPDGSRFNPFPTIGAGLAAALVGDTVAVLPGVYTENVVLKTLVRLVSADPSSTDTSVIPGNALATVIRAPANVGGQSITVQGSNLASVGSFSTELSGFTIANPLVGSPSAGPIASLSVGVLLSNSDVLVSDNYIIDSHFGVGVLTSGANAASPRIVNNGLIGNLVGMIIDDQNQTQSLRPGQVTQVNNNTIAFNTTGVLVQSLSNLPVVADIVNNIFWQNNDRSAAANGQAIQSVTPNKALVRSNLFGPGNGPNSASAADDVINVGLGLIPAVFSSVPSTDPFGNFTGDPAFTRPSDPRPNADGPGRFFNSANFDLQSNSAAIDNALNAAAPPTDFLNRGRVDVAGKGFPGLGPADVGAFEAGGTPPSSASQSLSTTGTFRAVTSSLVPGGAAPAQSQTRVFSAAASTPTPPGIVVTFSQQVERSSVSPLDLILSGDGLDDINPAKASGLNWIDDKTVEFLMTGALKDSGTVVVKIPDGAVLSANQSPMPAFSDIITLSNGQASSKSKTGLGQA